MTYQEMADEISALLEARLRVRGRDLETKVKKAGRLLPRFVRRQAAILVQSLKLQGNPKLARMLDDKSVLNAYKTCEKHLSAIDSYDQRIGRIIGFLSTNAFNMIVVTALLLAVLIWRGFL